MSQLASTTEWKLPTWITPFVDTCLLHEGVFESVSGRMRFVIELALANIEHETGGPFAAAIFNQDELVSVGVNLVTTQNASSAHAEIVAIAMAQTALDTHDLSTVGSLELVTSTEPCAMCLGAIPWSGLRHVVCGASGDDAEAAGFNEGCKPEPWQRALTERGITLQTGVEKERAAAVFSAYLARGGTIY